MSGIPAPLNIKCSISFYKILRAPAFHMYVLRQQKLSDIFKHASA